MKSECETLAVNNLWSRLMFWAGFKWEFVEVYEEAEWRTSSPQGTFVDWDWFWWDKGQPASNPMSFRQRHQQFVFLQDANGWTRSHRCTLYMSVTVVVTVEMWCWRVWASVLVTSTCQFGYGCVCQIELPLVLRWLIDNGVTCPTQGCNKAMSKITPSFIHSLFPI